MFYGVYSDAIAQPHSVLAEASDDISKGRRILRFSLVTTINS
jgi:hypothetical protein